MSDIPNPDANIYSLISLPDLFNRLDGLSSFGATVIYDLRNVRDFYTNHLPGSTSLHVSMEDVANKISLEELGKNKLVGTNMEKKSFKNARARKQVIIISETFDITKDHIESNEKTSPSSYLASLIFNERKARNIMVLNSGFKAFNERYSFISCSYTDNEIDNIDKVKHNHKKTIPWYPSEVLESFLFLGNHIDAKNLNSLKDLKITNIINVSTEVENYFPDEFTYLKFSLPDEESENLVQHFTEAFNFLDQVLESKQKVLVHCHQGVSRSATIVLAYIMKLKHYSLKQTYNLVKNLRPKVFPNLGFWYQLAHFEETLFEGQCTLDECVDVQLLLEEKADKEEANRKDRVEELETKKTDNTSPDSSLKEESFLVDPEPLPVVDDGSVSNLETQTQNISNTNPQHTLGDRTISVVEKTKLDLLLSSQRVIKEIALNKEQENKRRLELIALFTEEGKKGRILSLKQKLASAGLKDGKK